VRRLRPELLQWYGLFGAALAWTAQHVVTYGVAVANCMPAYQRLGFDVTTWVIVLTALGLVFAVSAEAAAIRVLVLTRAFHYDDPPPLGREHFFAFGAALGNVLFIMAIILDAVGGLSHTGCRPA
jgi:hypothetical protein